VPEKPATLADMRSWARQLKVERARCPRRGRASVERLIAAHDEGMTLVELRRVLPGDRAKRHARVGDRCAPGFPQLPEIARELFGSDWWR
jgi:hypothetical protein